MELRQLKYFVAVARARSFTEAARSLHISQPGISSQIQHLEDELKTRLLDRSSRSVELTPVGRRILAVAERLLDEEAAIHEIARESKKGLIGVVRFGKIHGLGTDRIPIYRTIANFSEQHPNVTIHLSDSGTDQLVASINRGELDLAVVGGEPAYYEELMGTPVRKSRLELIVLSDRIEEAQGWARDLSLLEGQRILSLPRDTPARRVVDLLLGRYQLQVQHEATSPVDILDLVEARFGVAILPDGIVPGARSELAHVPLDQQDYDSIPLSLVWSQVRRERPAVKAFREHLESDIASTILGDDSLRFTSKSTD
ncbi:MAG: LysR family transcriptional regulator [Gordonia sp. (in: high G+C Gram-positive bacteria)]